MEILKWYYKKRNKHKVEIYKNRLIKGEIDLIVLLRIRNEELIIEDTLEHISTFCNQIIIYDDCSEDKTLKLVEKNKNVIAIIKNFNWLSNIQDRLLCETNDRLKILNLAKKFKPKWIMYLDADERIIGDIKGFINSKEADQIDAVRISLFDAYITSDDNMPYKDGQLLNFRKFFGPEKREILMLWKNKDYITYKGLDSREPVILPTEKVITKFYCQHYGKSLSINHWEETCQYYLKHFPYESYGRKWENRIGKAIHNKSDFDTPLYPWGGELFENSIKIYPIE